MSDHSQSSKPDNPNAASRCRRIQERAEAPAKPSLTQLIRGFPGLLPSEPFRLFFPLGIFAGLLAVMLWPAYYWGWFEPHPAIIHARIMIEGWFGAFVLGFLGTAGPRMLTAPRLQGPEAGVLVVLWGLCVMFHLMNEIVIGDFFFLLALSMFLVLLFLRGLVRKDVPPPGFAMVFLGMLSGLAGAIILILSASITIPASVAHGGKLFLYQAFLLLPILGVGQFLFPRFLGLPPGQDFEESPTPPPGWTPAFLKALGFGLLFLGTYALEAVGEVRWGAGLRAMLLGYYLLWIVPLIPWKRGRGTMATILRLGLICLPLGYACIAWLPGYVIAMEHIVFIGGFGLITIAVGSRVVLGHSGRRPFGKISDNVMRVALAFILLALATRVSADFIPKVLISHHIYAAICWAGAMVLWMVHIIPNVLIPDPDDD